MEPKELIQLLGWTLPALFVLLLFVLRYVFQYNIEDRAILVKLLGRKTLRRIAIDDIEEIKVLPVWSREALNVRFYFVEKWPGWAFTRKVVLIKKRQGISREVVLYPQKPEEFLEMVLRIKNQSLTK